MDWSLTIDGIDILLQHRVVSLPLHLRKTNIDINFLLHHPILAPVPQNTKCRTHYVTCYIRLDPPQQERPQYLMQRLNHFLALLLGPFCILMQEAIQIRILREDLRTDEIQQRNQLLQTILQQRSCDETSTGDKGPNDHREDGIDVLDAMRVVDDDILETKFS
jgi:hypothetical protein